MFKSGSQVGWAMLFCPPIIRQMVGRTALPTLHGYTAFFSTTPDPRATFILMHTAFGFSHGA